MKKIIKAEPLKDYKILIEFDNGEKRITDITSLLSKPVFAFLKDISYFNSVYVEYGAIAWKDCNGNEVDLCPDKLYMDSIPA